ncbi:MAG: molybdopterin cofactor-binding domain-containing protein [Thermodesulfobacteriota bacterium]
MTELSVVGKPVPRLDARAKVTGDAIYTADIRLPRMLYGKILRSPHAHARMISIDATEALKLPGVEAVATANDLPAAKYGEFLHDQTAFAVDKVRCIGEPVGAVAAVDEATAEKALDLIKVEYEPLPPIFDMEEALKPDAPLIHEQVESYHSVYEIIRYGNVACHIKVNRGDVEKAFREADYVFEDRFTTPIIHNGYIEPHAAIAQVDRSGNITLWASIQSVFTVRHLLADIFKVPFGKIRVIAPKVGGGFGGKLCDVILEPACIALSQKTGRPVKIVMTREEEFIASNPRHAGIVEIKSGCMRDGTLVARQARVLYDTGGYAASGTLVINVGTLKVFGPYRIPNVKADGYCIYTNNPKTGAMRGFGSPQAVFAVESHMDMIAERLGMDPLALRMKNAFVTGDVNCTGQVMECVHLKQTIREAAEHGNWGKKLEKKHRGRGMACAQFQASGMPACAFVRVNEDGTISVLSGVTDIGQGAETVICQIVAEELGVSVEAVTLVTADTGVCPYDAFTIGDRVTMSVGHAVRLAAADARRQIIGRVAEIFHCQPEDLDLKNGKVSLKARPEQAIPLIGVSMQAHYANREGPIMGKGTFFFQEPPHEEGSVKSALEISMNVPNYTTQIAEVEVDEETGRVDLLKITASQDVGLAINPPAVRGQMLGGIMNGVGYALIEGYELRDGKVLNRALLDNRLPGAMDTPEIEALIVEEKSILGPYGSKPVGNLPLIPTAPAIANAVYDAVGVRIKDLPITPHKILQGLKKKQAKGQRP